MGCFSRSVKHVADTSIFGRVSKRGNQVTIYSMSYEAGEDLAMILPIPVKKGTTEDGLEFVNLEKFPSLFSDLDNLFSSGDPFGGVPASAPGSRSSPKLKVKQVGSFEASFVPAIKDFDRLEERFRIDKEIWNEIPQYADYGFAVFKLRAGKAKVHPMAFAFPSADPERIFFPTLHIHDGKIHKSEMFDHALYCQTFSSKVKLTWAESSQPINKYISLRSKKTIGPFSHVYKKNLRGELVNEDVWIPNK